MNLWHLAAVASLVMAPLSALADTVRFAFSGTVTSATPELFADLGVVPGATVEGFYDFDPDTPRNPFSPDGRYDDPFTEVFLRIGSYTAEGPHPLGGCCDSITVTESSYGVNVFLPDTPDVLKFETLQILLFAGDEPFFADDSLPIRPPDLSRVDPVRSWQIRFFGANSRQEPPSRGEIRFALDSFLLVPVIDIKPGSDLNPINLSRREIVPVAILGSDTLDVAEIDVTTLAFGPAGAVPIHKVGGHRQDVDGDGLTDLVSHYRSDETGLASDHSEACVAGELVDDTAFEGCDAIHTLPACRSSGSGGEC